MKLNREQAAKLKYKPSWNYRNSMLPILKTLPPDISGAKSSI
jgi:hypothetical protein